MRSLVLSMALGLLASVAYAGDACCPPACDPGCCDPCCAKKCDGHLCSKCGCKMGCKIVCDIVEIKKKVWDVECEPICMPCPRICCRCCKDPGCCDCGCEEANCGGCGCKSCDPCAVEQCKPRVPPLCCKPRNVKKLVKKEVVCKVPCYKCVPVCGHCGCCDPCTDGGNAAPVEGGSPTPTTAPAPAPEAGPGLPPPPKTTRLAPFPPVIGTSYSDR